MARTLWIIALCGFLVRVLFVLATRDIGAPTSMDSGTYHRIALNLLEGKGFSEDGVNPSLFVAPLYPFLIAAVYALAGVHPLLVELLQALLGAATALLVFLLGRDLFGRGPALIAFVVALFIPELLVLNTFLYTETLFIFLFLLSLWLAQRAIQQPTWSRLALAGFIAGITTLTRGVTMFLPLLLCLAFLLRHSFWTSLRLVLIYSLFFVLPIVPWTIRNYRTFHAVVPVAVGSGDVLWTGNYLPLDGKYSYDKTMALMDSMTVGMNQVNRDQKLTDEAIKNMAAQPSATAGLWARKFYRFWFWVYESAPTGAKRHGGTLVQLVLSISYYPILFLFWVGLWLSRKEWRRLFLFYLILGYYVALHVVMMVVPRYRMPVLPLMILFASLALIKLWQSWHSRARA